MSSTIKSVTTFLVLASLIGCGACGGDKKDTGGGGTTGGKTATKDGGGSAKPAYAADQGTATLKGTIKFKGTPPAQTPVDKSSEGTCAPVVTVREKIEVNQDGTVPHAFVWASAGPSCELSGYPSKDATVDQKGCVYIPHVVGVTDGAKITFTNSDGVSHNVHAKGNKNKFNQSQSAGAKDSFDVSKELKPVRIGCDVHGWMSCFMIVMDHPFGAASAQGTGTYEIKGLYPGKHTIKLWHENAASEAMIEVDLKAGETTQDFEVEFKEAK